MLGISLSTDLKKENENVISGKKKKKENKKSQWKSLGKIQKTII